MGLRWHLYMAFSFISYLTPFMGETRQDTSALLRMLNILGMSVPACSCCCNSWVCPRSSSGLHNIFPTSITERYALRLDRYHWQRVWENTGRCVGKWSSSVFSNFTLEQVQNPSKIVKYLEKLCCQHGNSRQTVITAMSWGCVQDYRILFNAI